MASLIRESERPRKPWRVDFVERGRRRTRRFRTRDEAQTFIGDLARGARGATSGLTVGAWLAQWLETHGPEWEARTRHDRARYGDKWIVPYLGRVRLRDLMAPDIRAFRRDILTAGATPYVANTAVTILGTALGDAVEDGLLHGNPCAAVRPLRRDVEEVTPAALWEVEWIRALVPTAEDRLAVSLMAYGGLRPAEVRALEVTDITEEAVTVRRAVGADRRRKRTKTGGTRTVPMIPALAEDVAAVGRRPGPVAGIGDWDNWTGRVFRRARARCGATCHPYALRHTFASLLIAEGRSVHEVARLLGHSTPQLTLTTYGHLFDEAQLRAGESMAAAVARARGEVALNVAGRRSAARVWRRGQAASIRSAIARRDPEGGA